jgi:murein L,D-transpeptidase YafK
MVILRRLAMFSVLLLVVVVVTCRMRERAAGKETTVNAPGSVSPTVAVPARGLALVVVKQTRKLTLYREGKAVHEYQIGLGLAPTGAKQKQGDYRTPEGNYYICTRNPQSSYTVSLGISYPNIQDAARGLTAGLITKRQYDQILQAIKHKQQPLWNTALGGEIMLHGKGAQSDWTWGCIALEDEDIRELFGVVPLKTPVIIVP